VNLVELKDNQLPDSMKRAMARQAEAERGKRAKFIAAEGESMAAAALGDASGTMMARRSPLATAELADTGRAGWRRNTTVMFPSPIMARSAASAPGKPLPRKGSHPRGNSQTIGTTGASHNQHGAGERRGMGLGHGGV
jgi:hypothetical protein